MRVEHLHIIGKNYVGMNCYILIIWCGEGVAGKHSPVLEWGKVCIQRILQLQIAVGHPVLSSILENPYVGIPTLLVNGFK